MSLKLITRTKVYRNVIKYIYFYSKAKVHIRYKRTCIILSFDIHIRSWLLIRSQSVSFRYLHLCMTNIGQIIQIGASTLMHEIYLILGYFQNIFKVGWVG